MHALHRPRVSRVIAVTVTAALLAIVLTLAITSSVRDLGSAPASASPPATVSLAAPGTRLATSPFTRSPFSSLLRAPVVSPWAQASR